MWSRFLDLKTLISPGAPYRSVRFGGWWAAVLLLQLVPQGASQDGRLSVDPSLPSLDFDAPGNVTFSLHVTGSMTCTGEPGDAMIWPNKVGHWSGTIYWQHGPREIRLRPQSMGEGVYRIDEHVQAWVSSEELPARPYWTNLSWLGSSGGGTVCANQMWTAQNTERVRLHLEAAQEPTDYKFSGTSAHQLPWFAWWVLLALVGALLLVWHRRRAR